MKAEPYLKQYALSKTQFRALEQKIEELVSACRESRLPDSVKKVYAAREAKMEEQLALAADRVLEGQMLLLAAGLTENEKQYLRLKYQAGLTAVAIAAEMGFSERQVTRLRKSALEKVQAAMEAEAFSPSPS